MRSTLCGTPEAMQVQRNQWLVFVYTSLAFVQLEQKNMHWRTGIVIQCCNVLFIDGDQKEMIKLDFLDDGVY